MTSRAPSRFTRRAAAWLLLAAVAAGASAAHHHSLFADIYEGGEIQSDHDHVLTSHDPRSHATHFHAILGTEHDACAACHGVRGLGRPAGTEPVSPVLPGEHLPPALSVPHAERGLRAGSSRGPPASV